jgi:hypothetical protein
MGVELPLEIYEEITGFDALPPPVDQADHERRKHRRIPFGCRVMIFPERKTGDNTPCVAMVRDMSVGGLSMLISEPLKPPTPFVIEFKGHRDRPVKMRCTSARCETGGFLGTEYVVGAAFDELLSTVLTPQELHEKDPPVAPLVDVLADTSEPVSEELIEETLRESSDVADSASAPAPAAAPRPEEPAPVFRVVPMPQEPPKAEVVAAECDPQTCDGRATNQEILARVKELLLQQEQLIERQRQELIQHRLQVESMRSEMEEAKKKLAELKAKSDADDGAIADLATFLKQRAGAQSPAQADEAA